MTNLESNFKISRKEDLLKQDMSAWQTDRVLKKFLRQKKMQE